MAKSEMTKRIERAIYGATKKQGVFSCFEVTIGWFGNERVDYLTYDTKGVWRCYEIKSTKSDFHSKAAKTFCGDLNYYVMPLELYNTLKNEIPDHIGVYAMNIGGFAHSVKKAKRQPCCKSKTLYDSMIRSLSREYDKLLYQAWKAAKTEAEEQA